LDGLRRILHLRQNGSRATDLIGETGVAFMMAATGTDTFACPRCSQRHLPPCPHTLSSTLTSPCLHTHSQVRSTEENLHLARHWLTDSARLRKAIRHAIYNARTSEHEASGSLNSAMMVKLSTTHKLKDDIEAQLAKVGPGDDLVLCNMQLLSKQQKVLVQHYRSGKADCLTLNISNHTIT
jgi:hypothetical protein